jgi:hypothetical protein
MATAALHQIVFAQRIGPNVNLRLRIRVHINLADVIMHKRMLRDRSRQSAPRLTI